LNTLFTVNKICIALECAVTGEVLQNLCQWII